MNLILWQTVPLMTTTLLLTGLKYCAQWSNTSRDNKDESYLRMKCKSVSVTGLRYRHVVQPFPQSQIRDSSYLKCEQQKSNRWFVCHAPSLQTVYQWQGVLVVEHAVDVVDNLSGVVVGDLTRPACPDALSAVHQHHRNDGNVPLGLHLLVVIIQELQQV